MNDNCSLALSEVIRNDFNPYELLCIHVIEICKFSIDTLIHKITDYFF